MGIGTLAGKPRDHRRSADLASRVWQVELFARGKRTDVNEWDTVLAEVIVDRASFYAAARRDLGIESGDVPPGEPWEAPATRRPRPPTAT